MSKGDKLLRLVLVKIFLAERSSIRRLGGSPWDSVTPSLAEEVFAVEPRLQGLKNRKYNEKGKKDL
jgi:hypothetical protein